MVGPNMGTGWGVVNQEPGLHWRMMTRHMASQTVVWLSIASRRVAGNIGFGKSDAENRWFSGGWRFSQSREIAGCIHVCCG